MYRALVLSRLYRIAIALGFLAVAAAWSDSSVVSAFADDKVIEVEPQHRNDPVMITRVAFRDSDLQCGLIASRTEVEPVTPFEAGDDWLQNLTLYLLNRTNKTIAFSNIVLAFPETGDGRSPQHPQRVYNLNLGRLPDFVAFSGRTGEPLRQDPSRQSMSFAPGQTLPIHLGDYIDHIKASLDDIPFTVTKCIIRRSSVVFDDGMRWDGNYSLPDPDHPGKWKRVEGDYFPGIPTWPPNYHQ
ncbi:MAG: hypothetical protein WCB12_18390 [Bryobacteraceae bacterium]